MSDSDLPPVARSTFSEPGATTGKAPGVIQLLATVLEKAAASGRDSNQPEIPAKISQAREELRAANEANPIDPDAVVNLVTDKQYAKYPNTAGSVLIVAVTTLDRLGTVVCHDDKCCGLVVQALPYFGAALACMDPIKWYMLVNFAVRSNPDYPPLANFFRDLQVHGCPAPTLKQFSDSYDIARMAIAPVAPQVSTLAPSATNHSDVSHGTTNLYYKQLLVLIDELQLEPEVAAELERSAGACQLDYQKMLDLKTSIRRKYTTCSKEQRTVKREADTNAEKHSDITRFSNDRRNPTSGRKESLEKAVADLRSAPLTAEQAAFVPEIIQLLEADGPAQFMALRLAAFENLLTGGTWESGRVEEHFLKYTASQAHCLVGYSHVGVRTHGEFLALAKTDEGATFGFPRKKYYKLVPTVEKDLPSTLATVRKGKRATSAPKKPIG